MVALSMPLLTEDRSLVPSEMVQHLPVTATEKHK